MIALTRLLATALAAGALAALAWASAAPLTIDGSSDAVLRVAWSARPERVEECREQSAEELERLPAHMRQPLVCEGVAAGYRLRVIYDGRLLDEQIVRGGGLRQDRRLYVFREFALPPGEGRVEVRFDRLETPTTRRPGTPEAHGETVPPSLSFDRHLSLAPREVVLVTYRPDQRALVLMRGQSGSG